MLISQSYVERCFVNFWGIFGDVWKEIVSLKGLVKFGEIRNILKRFNVVLKVEFEVKN